MGSPFFTRSDWAVEALAEVLLADVANNNGTVHLIE